MIYKNINTNLAGDSFQKLNNGVWKLGLIKDNYGINDKSSDFYTLAEVDMCGEKKSIRVFRL